MSIAAQREAEVGRYTALYRDSSYGLGARRREHIFSHLRRLPRGSLLDVSTGRGEVIGIALDLGFSPVQGTEAVPYLCNGVTVVHALAHSLPFADDAFDTVTMFDVMEHLVPEDTAAVCHELKRVARNRVLLTVHNEVSTWRGADGNLHINRRADYEAWHAELSEHFQCEVIRHGRAKSISELFEVLLDA